MRMPNFPALALAAALLSFPLAAQEKVEVVEPTAKAPRGVTLEWKSAEGKPYWYRLPKTVRANQPPTLLVMLHGTGLDHRWSAFNYWGGSPEWRRHDVILSPDGLTPGNGAFNFVQGAKDGDHVAALIQDFKKRFRIGRVYLYGHSQGAFFCYWFAGEHPELVDGIVAHAGNVLDNVKHGKLAKQKLAVGILHARSDQVVTVECATWSEKVYREQGYQKVKLWIVEGIRDEAGHWPLPPHVSEMLDWVDQVSGASAAQAVGTAASELQRALPDLGVVAEQLGKARKLLPKADEAEKKELPPVLDAMQVFLDKAVRLHGQALLAEPATTDPKGAYGTWAPHFQLANRAFGDHAEWKKVMAKPREAAVRHDRAVEKALKALEKAGNDKAAKEVRAAAAKVWEESFLSARSEELRTALVTALTAAGAAEAAVLERVQAHASVRTEATAAAKKVAGEIHAPLLAELATAAPSLFAADVDAGDSAK